MSGILVKIAKLCLRSLPARPSVDYLPVDKITDETGLRQAQASYDEERDKGHGFLRFFDGRVKLEGEMLLDLGSGYGGRSVEFNQLSGAHVVGIDIFTEATRPALSFARSMGAREVSFVTGKGEHLPFADASFDMVLSYDVLEHVESPADTLCEVMRVLKPGGRMLAVFPPFYHPTGAHLEGYVSRLPYANLIFSSKVLITAIDEILRERGDEFRPQSLRPTDRLYALNGITIRRFKKILKGTEFEVELLEMLPLISKKTRKYEAWGMRYYAWIFFMLARAPLLQELFTHRIVAVLRKPA
jgi:ubiquinone/menaquinone biosynthesis C-methylase UbiE